VKYLLCALIAPEMMCITAIIQNVEARAVRAKVSCAELYNRTRVLEFLKSPDWLRVSIIPGY
jgi:hypothetical protein